MNFKVIGMGLTLVVVALVITLQVRQAQNYETIQSFRYPKNFSAF